MDECAHKTPNRFATTRTDKQSRMTLSQMVFNQNSIYIVQLNTFITTQAYGKHKKAFDILNKIDPLTLMFHSRKYLGFPQWVSFEKKNGSALHSACVIEAEKQTLPVQYLACIVSAISNPCLPLMTPYLYPWLFLLFYICSFHLFDFCFLFFLFFLFCFLFVCF